MSDLSFFLNAVKEIEPILRKHAPDCDRERRLVDESAQAMRDKGLYKLLRPKALGGFEADPVTAFKVVEEIGRIDSAASWCLQGSINHDMFAPWFPDQGAREIFGGDAIVVGGQQPPRKAAPVDGGYLLSGRTPYVSGAHQATAFLGYAVVHDGDKPRLDADSAPVTLIVCFPAAGAEIIDTWRTFGMRGTGTHDVEIKDVFIPEHWTAPWEPLKKPGSAYQGPLYRLTVWPAIAALVPPALGIARAAIDGAVDLVRKKTPAFSGKSLRDNAVVQTQLARAEAKLRGGRAFFYEALDEVYQAAVGGKVIDMTGKALVQLASSHAVTEAAAAVDLVHEVVGVSGVWDESSFSGYFRDMHVITQHGVINAAKLEPVGRIMLGLEPEWPFFAF
jgi:indole-3-acetate monooxygenase